MLDFDLLFFHLLLVQYFNHEAFKNSGLFNLQDQICFSAGCVLLSLVFILQYVSQQQGGRNNVKVCR